MTENSSHQNFETERYKSDLSTALRPPSNGYLAKGFWGHLWMVVKEATIGAAAGLGASMAAIYGYGKFKDHHSGVSTQTAFAVPPWHEGKVYWSVIAGSAAGFIRGLLSAGSEKHSSLLRKQVYAQAEAFNNYAASAEHHISELQEALNKAHEAQPAHSHLATEQERRIQEQDAPASHAK